MTTQWWHLVGLLVVGIIIGYYFPVVGSSTVGKLVPKTAAG